MSKLSITGPRPLVQHLAVAFRALVNELPGDRASTTVEIDNDVAVPIDTSMGEVAIGLSADGPSITLEAQAIPAAMAGAMLKPDHVQAIGNKRVLRWRVAGERSLNLPIGAITVAVIA